MSLCPIPGPAPIKSPLRELFDNPAYPVPAAVRKRAEFFLFFADVIYPMLEAYRVALNALYCDNNGRPAIDPVLLQGVLVLQFIERMPDRQAAEAVQYNTCWKLALNLSLESPSFDPSLLVVFRKRLLTGELESLVFQAVLDRLVKDGWVAKRSKQRLDSTHVCGLLSHMSRLECVRETIRLALEYLERRQLLLESWTTLWERYVESKVDHRCTVETLKTKFLQAGKDMCTILEWANTQDVAIKDAEEIRLAQRVFDENYERDEQGEYQQTRAQPTGAVHNPHEPQAQWSSKSTIKDKTWVGYKTQVAETVQEEPREAGEPTQNFIAALITQNASESDKPGMAMVLSEQANMGLEPPPVLYVDGAYVCGPSLHEAQEDVRELHGPAPASPDRGKVFTVEAFDIKVEEQQAICPAGQTSSNCSRLREEKTGKVDYRFEWNNTLCGACPRRAECIAATQTHRTLVVGEYHTLLQARRREMLTEAFKLDMHHRNGIEGTQSELIRGYGLRHARYRSLAKTRLQNYLIGAACNLRRWFRRVQWEAARTPCALVSAQAAATGKT